MKIVNKINLKLKNFDIRLFIQNKIYRIKYFFKQIKTGAPLPLIAISYFMLGALVTNSHVNVPKWVGTIAAIFSAYVAYKGLTFAKSIFNRRYSVTSSHIYNFQNPLHSVFIVNFINRSRINTSVRFIGAIIKNDQTVYDSDNDLKISFTNLFPLSNPVSHNRKYNKYLYTLTNLRSFNSISFKIPVIDLIKFMNENLRWNYIMNKRFNIPNKKCFKIKFLFIDYNNKILSTVDKISPKNCIYKCMQKHFHSNSLKDIKRNFNE